MPLVVPDEQEVEVLVDRLTPAHTIRIYGNNITPSGPDTTSTYIEIVGGGYAAKPILFVNWTITPGNPSIAIYNTIPEWIFTGPIDVPGTVYGVFITRDSDNKLLLAEKFPAANIPFAPVVGSVIRYLPRYEVSSQF